MKESKLEELENERKRYEQGGAIKEIEKQHKKGKLTARERVDLLFDEGTFIELDLWAQPLETGFEDLDEKFLPGDACIIGYGKVNGRKVMVYAHDFTQMSGTQAAVQHSKVTKVMDVAAKMAIPYVGLVDCAGIRLQDMMGEPLMRPPVWGYGLGGSGDFMFSVPNGSGVIPQISVMLGPQFAGSSYSPIMSDFLIMRNSPNVFMSLISPPVIKEVVGEEVTYDEIGSSKVHSEITGTCDFVVDTDEEAIEKAKELIEFLPSNWKEKPPIVKSDDLAERRDEELLDFLSMGKKGRKMHNVIQHIVDNGHFLEIKPDFARNIIVGFGRFDGQSVGMVANNSIDKQGALDINASDKGARFVRFCDCFNIPLVFLVDSIGLIDNQEEEKAGLERHAAKLPYAICESSVPKVTIYVGECSGDAEYMMGTEAMGVDLVLAWPTAKIGHLEPGNAVDVIYENELRSGVMTDEIRNQRIGEFAAKYCNIYHAGGRQLVNDIIDPRDTRRVVIDALDYFKGKQDDVRPWKKHGNIPL